MASCIICRDSSLNSGSRCLYAAHIKRIRGYCIAAICHSAGNRTCRAHSSHWGLRHSGYAGMGITLRPVHCSMDISASSCAFVWRRITQRRGIQRTQQTRYYCKYLFQTNTFLHMPSSQGECISALLRPLHCTGFRSLRCTVDHP